MSDPDSLAYPAIKSPGDTALKLIEVDPTTK